MAPRAAKRKPPWAEARAGRTAAVVFAAAAQRGRYAAARGVRRSNARGVRAVQVSYLPPATQHSAALHTAPRGPGIEGLQGPIGHGEVGAEEALGNADEYVVKTAPVYSFTPKILLPWAVKYSFWVI